MARYQDQEPKGMSMFRQDDEARRVVVTGMSVITMRVLGRMRRGLGGSLASLSLP